jgi:2,3-bisphosphoglycerate-independent phosphoglycerate mutase
MILDGWGLNDNLDQKNAIREANPVNFNKYWNEYPHTRLMASGEDVGLPDGQMGNSEVGHLNLGAGRVVYQLLVKISKEIREKTIYNNEVLKDLMTKTKETGKALHLSGLISDGGVHSHITHLYGLLEMAKEFGLTNVYVHALLDGRDTPPSSGLGFIEELEKKMAEIGVGKIATISGRFYTMDRDKRWDRVEKGYNAIVHGSGDKALSAKKTIEMSYLEEITDEFIKPTVIVDRAGNPTGILKEGDGFLFINFRPDRAREITRAIVDKDFNGFMRTENPNVNYVCMAQYDSSLEVPVVYPSEELTNTLGEVISKAGLTQFRTAETEKYAHVTFFFNGGVETEFKGEDRKLIPSPKVATYDLQPEMSAEEVAVALLEALDSEKYDVLLVNFANPDMLGHTGIMDAAITAVKKVDDCVSRVVKKVLEKNGTILITADHGNVDLMEDPETHVAFTANTTNHVPLIIVSEEYKNVSLLENGKLADIAPTMLKLLNIEIPKEMTGNVLIK